MIPSETINLTNSHLRIACSKDFATFVHRLLDKRVNIDRQVLSSACSSGNIGIVRAVVEDYILIHHQITSQAFFLQC